MDFPHIPSRHRHRLASTEAEAESDRAYFQREVEIQGVWEGDPICLRGFIRAAFVRQPYHVHTTINA